MLFFNLLAERRINGGRNERNDPGYSYLLMTYNYSSNIDLEEQINSGRKQGVTSADHKDFLLNHLVNLKPTAYMSVMSVRTLPFF